MSGLRHSNEAEVAWDDDGTLLEVSGDILDSDGQVVGKYFHETPEGRERRAEKAAEDASKRFRLTPGQLKTLRRVRR